jgi:hypothetical protein
MRVSSDSWRQAIDNFKKTGMSSSDKQANLNKANLHNPVKERDVIMETAGDVSILHRLKDGPDISDNIFSAVQR